MTPILSVELPIELRNGNTGRGHAHWQSTKTRKAIESAIQLYGYQRKPFEVPVRLRITRVLGQRQRLWDADSILRGNAKELIDSLVACGWFHDDGPKWVTEVIGAQDSSRRVDGPAVLVEVFEEDDDEVV